MGPRCHHWQNLPIHMCQEGNICPVASGDAPELLPSEVIKQVHAAYVNGKEITVTWNSEGRTSLMEKDCGEHSVRFVPSHSDGNLVQVSLNITGFIQRQSTCSLWIRDSLPDIQQT